MRCIFCKRDSSNSRKIEHIVPQSLGNLEHVLPAGIVCDSCNSYFGLKIEKPLLDSHYFRQARFRNLIYNKEYRIPTIEGLILPGLIPMEMLRDEEGQSIFPSREGDMAKFVEILKAITEGKLIFPVSERPDERLMSRFLAKVALEVLASRSLSIPDALDEVIYKDELDKLRYYARFGSTPTSWPFNMRRIYSEGNVFSESSQKYEVLHEFTLLYTESKELYLVIGILGIEYTLNMVGPEIDGYTEWLRKHCFQSPLYIDNG